MIGFEVLRNGEKVCAAAIEARHVLTVIVQSVPFAGTQRLELLVGGLESGTNTHQVWIEDVALAVGDEISVRVADMVTVDTPVRTYPA